MQAFSRLVAAVVVYLLVAAGLGPGVPGLTPENALAAIVSTRAVPKLHIVLIGSSIGLMIEGEPADDADRIQMEKPLQQLMDDASAAIRADVAALEAGFKGLAGRASIENLVTLIDRPGAEIVKAIAGAAAAAKLSGGTTIIYWAGATHVVAATGSLELLAIDSSRNRGPHSAAPAVDGTIDLSANLLPLFDLNQPVVLVCDDCYFPPALVAEVSVGRPRLSLLSMAKDPNTDIYSVSTALRVEHGGVLARVLAKALGEPIEDVDGNGLNSLEEIFVHIYARAMKSAVRRQYPNLLGQSAYRTNIASALKNSAQSQRVVLKLGDSDLARVGATAKLSINGEALSRPAEIANDKLVLDALDAPKMRKGINYVVAKTTGHGNLADEIRSYNVWLEADTLAAFEKPYVKSHAVIVTVGDFARRNDPKQRGPTGLDEVPLMVDTSRDLADTLRRLGFETVHELYDADASKEKIEALLTRYWKGEEYQDVDRLFVYFGTHGIPYVDSAGKNGVLLATYDYDSHKLRSTNVLASDLLERHADNIAAKHVMFAIDACSAGFARFARLGEGTDPRESRDPDAIRKLQAFRDESQKKGRNVLVAGRDDQNAILEQGRSIFALKLIEGLSGKADQQNKGYWKFSDVQQWVKQEVSFEVSGSARSLQQPTSWSLNLFGDGEMLFYLSPQTTAAAALPPP